MASGGVLTGKRIGVFGKGGSGKSTFVVLLARLLRKRGYSVYVLDADSTNIGLAQALGIEHAPVPLLDYFGGMVFSGGLVTCPVDDPTPLTDAQIGLNDIPARYYARNQDGITLLTAGKIAGQGPGAGCDGPVAKIARDFSIQDHIDLHGYVSSDAYHALDVFLKKSVLNGIRAVLIVHGRGLSSPGDPVLKNNIIKWLTRGKWRKWVLAYTSARSYDGGAGGTYVLLRNRPLPKRLRRRQPSA